MSDTVVSLLTPPGTGAIATVEVRGPRAWELARKLFQRTGKPIPEVPEVNRFWFGTLGNDEVILAVTAACGVAVEVHCHGGRRVVQWVMDQFLADGCVEERNPRPKDEGFDLLQRAPTLRTASILLDQMNGAFANELQRILTLLESDPQSAQEPLRRLAELGNTIGRHLIEPWKVVVAGPPNVGKSSLVNALAGYQRSVVSETAGTTRDAVSMLVAFDGWPFELIDTAGLRDAEGLEAEGIARAEKELAEADLILWVMDASTSELTLPTDANPAAWVMNKSDLSVWPPDFPVAAIHVSALTGEGILVLVARIVEWLIPNPPSPGSAVPYTPRCSRLIESARTALYYEKPDESAWCLREALHESEASATDTVPVADASGS